MVNRIRPKDIGKRIGSSKLATRKLKEVRCQVYTDQAELLETWCVENNTTPTNIVRKLINYFLHAKEGQRQRIIREY